VTDIATDNNRCCAPGNGFAAAAVPQQKPPVKPTWPGRISSVSRGGLVTKELEQGMGFTWGILLLLGSAKAPDGDSDKAGRVWGT